MTNTLLDPKKKYPMVMPNGNEIQTVVHLNQVVDHPRIEIGDFSYFGHFEVLDNYAAFLAPYLFPLSPEKLIMGKFCQIAHGVRFITSSANHNMRAAITAMRETSAQIFREESLAGVDGKMVMVKEVA